MSYFCLPVAEQFPCQRILFEIIVITFHNPDASMRNPHNLPFSWFSSPSSRVFQTFCLFLCFLYHSLKLFSWAWESPSVTSLRFLLQEADGFAFASADNPWSAHYTVETRGAVGLEDLKKKKKTEFALPADSSRLSDGLSGQIRRPDVCGCEREQGRNDRVSVSLRRGAVLQLLHIFLPTVLNETCACCYFHVENNLAWRQSRDFCLVLGRTDL